MISSGTSATRAGNAFIRNLAIQTKCHPTLDCVPTNLAANGFIVQLEKTSLDYRFDDGFKNPVIDGLNLNPLAVECLDYLFVIGGNHPSQPLFELLHLLQHAKACFPGELVEYGEQKDYTGAVAKGELETFLDIVEAVSFLIEGQRCQQPVAEIADVAPRSRK